MLYRRTSLFIDLLCALKDLGGDAIPLGEAVEGIVALANATDKAADNIGGVGTGVAALLVDVADVDLHRRLVAGTNDAARSGATDNSKSRSDMTCNVTYNYYNVIL